GVTLGLAQRRLSILDLSPLGHQPMHSSNGRVSIVFNGEIYNYQELKKELADYPYVSTCDTEVILAAYLRWGIQFVERIKGMFAIALYDREVNELYLIRDRIGKKPLYFWNDSEHFVFASELKPIMAYPYFQKQINQEVLGRYLYQQYLTGPEAIFQKVYKVSPGGIVKYKDGVVTQWKYWDIKTVYHKKKGTGPKDYEEAKFELKRILEASVRQRMIADVPLGSFLSGGYDSSLVSAIAQSVSEQPVKTFSIGFHEEKYNEAIYAKEVAKHLGTEHTEMYIDEQDMLRLVDSIPKYFDEPFADSSQIATMLVSELAKKHVTVALSGDGGDEFFCGYNLYTKVLQAQKLDKIGAIAHQIGRIGNLEKHYPFKMRVISKNRNKDAKTQFVGGNTLKVAQSMVREPGICCYYDRETAYNEANWQERRMLLDMDTYLPGDILCKVDRASMKYSLESRCPILDVDVMEFAFSIPHEFKYKEGMKKRILKDLTYEYIPKELLERPKVGFAVPMDKWLRGPLKEQLLEMADVQYLKEQGLFEENYVSDFITNYLNKGDAGAGSGSNYSRMIWAFYVFQQWYQTYI
ncbi:MAG: asparagine synthase (glutamine-hydrolyzing), partial [Lachnospiraceae bacterium]|nr:asparagine synthase (glutamine-hydrolyzing) [Lachnospiraceae bacterium]